MPGRAWCAESAPPGAVVAAGFGRCRLSAGERPPQFVVLSFDGAGVDSQGWFPVFREAAAKDHASMTFFLSGVYLLPQEKRKLYHPPGHAPGSSDIGFQRRSRIGPQIAELTKAYNAGHEIGTHFNGHFCGSDGVRSWSAADWRQEIEQFFAMVTNWRRNSGLPASGPGMVPDLPFDIRKVVHGGRTPCLEGDRTAMFKAFNDFGWRYDASGTGTVRWPHRRAGLWQLPLPAIAVPGTRQRVLGMDYNFYTLQSGARTQDRESWQRWGRQMGDALLHAVDTSFRTDRAPVIIGNHFESWNGGIYMRALLRFMDQVCTRPQTRCVSFEQLADWLNAQDPAVLESLRKKPAES